MRKMALHHSFEGKRVLVTGGGRGLGYDMVKRFYEDGANVFVIDQSEVLLIAAKAEMPRLETICLDVTDWDATYKAVMEIGPLDILVNNAGVLIPSPLLDVKPQDFDLMIGVNVRSILCVSQAFVKGVIEHGTEGSGGAIVNISSMADRVGFWGCGIYAISKACVSRLTMAMSLEFAPFNIRVNSINPSFIPTEMVKSIPGEIFEKSTNVVERIPFKEPLEAKDVTDGVLFLASSLSSKITGITLVLDGGLRIA